MSVVNKVVVKNVAYDIEDAKTKQALSKEVARAQAKENELEKELEDVQNTLNTTESVTEVSWGASSNMNSFTTAGVYNIKGERTNANDNLPISNIGENATIAARLIVTVTPEGTTTYRHSVGQTLILSNAEGKETKVYTRNGNRTSNNGGVTYTVTWGEWANLQTNVNVGQVASLDSFVDNGIYSGVWVKNAAQVETFVMIVINNYAAATQAGVPKSITQFKYSIAVGGSMPIYETRVGISENDWKPWEEIASKDIISQMISNEISKVIDSAPDAFDTLKEVADWILNDKTGAAAMATQINANTNAINEERERAEEAESGLNDAIRLNYEDITSLQNNVEKNAMQYNTLGVGLYKDKATIYGRSLYGTPREVDFPAATSESAGVMTAEDKKEQVKITPLVNGDIIVGQTREIYSRQGKVDSATFLKRTTAGSTSVSDGVASVKQIGGNIVKNLVDTSFVGSKTLGVVNSHIYYFSTVLFNGQLHFAETSTGVYNGWKQHSIISKATSDSVTITVEGDNALNVLLIDLTEEYGAGNEPTKEECDRMFSTMDALPQGLTIAQPTGLKSTGYNQWNPKNVLVGKTITDDAIVDGDKNIAIVECLPCKIGAGENNGYVIGYGEGDTWSDDGIEVYLTPLNPMEVEGDLYMHKLERDSSKGTFVPQCKGYLLIVTPTTDKLCAHLLWSGDREFTDYEEYIESNVALPVIPQLSEWGLAGIQSSGTMAQDTIDLDRMVYTKRIVGIDLGFTMLYRKGGEDNNVFWINTGNAFFNEAIKIGVMCGEYTRATSEEMYYNKNNADKIIFIGKSGYFSAIDTCICIRDSRFTDATALQEHLKGIKAYYYGVEEEYPIVTKTAPNYIGSDYGVEEFTGSKIPLAANILFYMRSLVGETRNFLDRLMSRLGTSDATAVADKIADAIIPTTEGTDVEPTEVTEL